MKTIDLNCDLGEGTSARTVSSEAALMDIVTTVSIAGGAHAGSPAAMQETVRLAIAKGVRIGAHPGLPDREGLGRRLLTVTPADLEMLVLDQWNTLVEIVHAEGGAVGHIKPHGALYHMAAFDESVANALVRAVGQSNTSVESPLWMIGPPKSRLLQAARAASFMTAAEAFADRAYQADGKLVPRGQPYALITDPRRAAEQAVGIVQNGIVRSVDGIDVPIRVDTLCVHGDTPGALEIALAVREALGRAGIGIRAFVDVIHGVQDG